MKTPRKNDDKSPFAGPRSGPISGRSSSTRSRAELIAMLADDLEPVKRIRPAEGMALIAGAAVLASVISIAVYQLWDGLLAGEASGYFMITNGLLMILGVISALALVSTALPRVGARADAPLWGALMLGILPLGAVIGLISGQADIVHDVSHDPATFKCTVISLAAGSLVLAAATVWLRRGAPVSIERSGWLAGLAAGSLGAVAYGITCPLDSFAHVGLWHVAPVGIGAVIGRIAVPPMIRW